MLKGVVRLLKGLVNPCPSFFDLCVSGLLFTPFLKGLYARNVYFIFYTIFLIVLSVGMKPKREYRSLPLTLLVLWSFLNVFIHSFAISRSSTTGEYPVFHVLTEGFIYIFLAALVIKAVVEYSTNLRYIYLFIPLTMTPLYKSFNYTGSVTPIAAFGVSIAIYLLLTKRFKRAIGVSVIGIIGMVTHWPWICLKFACRPKVWSQLLINMFHRTEKTIDGCIIDPGIEWAPWLKPWVDEHVSVHVEPWLSSIFGGGFIPIMDSNYVWVEKNMYGWLYRQNDYLALGVDLGPIAMVLSLWLVIECMVRIGKRLDLILFMTVALICFFQVTMYLPFKAAVYLMIATVALTEGTRRKPCSRRSSLSFH